MAATPDKSQKTEPPSPKRLREARERGQIARTPDLGTWTGMLVATLLVQHTVTRGAAVFREVLRGMGEAAARPSEEEALRYLGEAAKQGLFLVAPLLVGLAVVAVVTNLAQVGLKPSLKRMKPDWKRLNVFKGLKRMVQPSSFWELGKSVAKTAVLVVVAWPIVRNLAVSLTTAGGASVTQIAGTVARDTLLLVRNVSFAGLTIAGADYSFKRRQTRRELMMTKQEVREEQRQQEGDPHVRHAMRSRQMSVSRNRMIRMVAEADAVIVNPTHFAVALKYVPGRPAPEVVAKGAGHVALRIRAEAEKHGVAIVREPLLARTMYRVCRVGGFVPVELYEAVAHVLAFVFGLRARGGAAGEHTLPGGLGIDLALAASSPGGRVR